MVLSIMLLIRSSIFFEFVYVPLPNFFTLYICLDALKDMDQ